MLNLILTIMGIISAVLQQISMWLGDAPGWF